MSTETTFTRRWKRPSPAFLLVIVITVVGLVVALGLPRLILPKFADRPTGLVFQVTVTDDQGIPIPNANVFIGSASGQTDLQGYVEVQHTYPGRGIKGLSGTCRLDGYLRVEAPGFIVWRRELADVFERHYDYHDKGTNLRHSVTVFR